MNNNMTALMCCFVRVYHTINSNIKIYNDPYSVKILTVKELDDISKNLKEGINFFNPNYEGTNPVRWIVNNNLAPTVLARSSYNEKSLLNEMILGLKQYVILASGYDMSAFKFNDKLKIFELDKESIIEDKIKRIKRNNLNTNNITYIKTDFNKKWINDLLNTNYNPKEKTFCSMLGISYYLDKKIFIDTIKTISSVIPKGSVIIFDYSSDIDTKKKDIIKALAKASKEEMYANYTYQEIEEIAYNSTMLVYEHLDYNDINNTIFYNYNTLNPNNRILAPVGIEYVMLVKR